MIIGLTGPICAGKDVACKILQELGFKRYSLSDEIREEMKRRGLEITRKGMQDYGDKIRKEEGAGALARRVMIKLLPGRNYVVDSIRNPSEVETLKIYSDFILLKVDASDVVRFQRMVERGREQDPKTFEDFIAVEAKDRGIGQATYGQQNEVCWKMADMVIVNEGAVEELKEEITKLIFETQKGVKARA